MTLPVSSLYVIFFRNRRLLRQYTRSTMGRLQTYLRLGGGYATDYLINSPNSSTFFWWRDGQNHRPLHEKARR